MTKTLDEKLTLKEESESRAREWSKFRRDNLFTQQKLAEILGVGRRTIQMIEAGKVLYPHPETIRKFLVLKAKYKNRKAA
jgi:DNA-binding XRE family transcriptional regulator